MQRITSLFLFLFVVFSVAQAKLAENDIYKRLTGLTPSLSDSFYLNFKKLMQNDKREEALGLLTKSSFFYNNILREVSSLILTADEQTRVKYNDALALIEYIVKNDKDAREILTANYLYVPRFASLGSDYDGKSNLLFEMADEVFVNKDGYFYKRSPQWPDNIFSLRTTNEQIQVSSRSDVNFDIEESGILTTRAWAEIYYKAGTNRRAVKGSFQAFICTPIEQWRDGEQPLYRIRRDIDRSPGKNPLTFRQECQKCHAPMDALAGAFAKVSFENLGNNQESLIFHEDVAAKYNQNTEVYPEGYVTTDSSWLNFATENHNKKFGWTGPVEGEGIKEYAAMLSRSYGFRACLVKRVYKKLCREDLTLTDEKVKALAKNFQDDSYNLRKLFQRVVQHEKCI